MPSDVTRSEFDHLRGRVDVVEREVEGEKMVTHHVLEQTRRNGGDLATVLQRRRGNDTRLDAVDTRLDRVEQTVDRREPKVDGPAAAIPGIVAAAVREAFREHGGRR